MATVTKTYLLAVVSIAIGASYQFFSFNIVNTTQTVVVGWIEWPDRATRDRGMAAIMQDHRMREAPPAWNGPLAIFGGFTPIHDTARA